MWKGRQFIGRARAELSLATPLCETILADWLPNRDIFVDWPGRRDKALKTGTVPAKTGRMVCLSMECFFFCERTRHDSFLSEVLTLPRDLFDARQTTSYKTPWKLKHVCYNGSHFALRVTAVGETYLFIETVASIKQIYCCNDTI